MGGVLDVAKKIGGGIVGSSPIGAIASGVGGALLGAGARDKGAAEMRQFRGTGLDPETQRRQLDLWNQAQRYAATNPFSQQYGDASAMPGMSQISQAGQQYLTNQILGPGQYEAQNLGFTDYQRPQQELVADPVYQPGTYREDLPIGDVFPGSPPASQRVGLLGSEDRAISPAVGIGEMEMGSLATRRMLEEAAPLTPTYTEIADPTIGTTTVGEVADIGSEVGQATVTGGAGVGAVAVPDINRTVVATPEEIAAQTIGAPGAVDVIEVVAPELAGVTGAGVQYITGRDIAGPAGVTIDPVTGQATEAVGGVAPGEFEAASFLGGPAIADYMNQAGVEAQIAQSEEDYQRQLNALQAQQAGTGAFGARAELEDLGALEAQQRNVAAIRGAGYERAAQRMEADAARRQQAGLQGQQLGVQTGLAGQALEAQRRESDAARAQQAALAGQQIGARAGMQTQQLEQQAVIQGAQNALTAAQANQRAVLQSGTQQQQLEAARQTEEARLGLAAAQQTQRLGVQTGMQTQELAQQADVQNAQNALVASRANLNAAVQSGDRQAQLDAQRQIREAELGVQTAMQTQQLGVQTGMQTQRLGTQVELQNAQNEIRIAEQNMQSALQRGDRQAMIDAQRQQQQAQMGLDAATRNQAAGLQAAGMGLDAQGRFRQQQMAGARQLADIGGLTQGATFGAAQQLDRMGAAQEQAQRDQQAWDYQQWLRGQEGGARELALAQSFMPGGMQQQFERRPSRFGQVFGGLLGAGGVARDIYDRFGNRTNQRSSGNNWNDQEGS